MTSLSYGKDKYDEYGYTDEMSVFLTIEVCANMVSKCGPDEVLLYIK